MIMLKSTHDRAMAVKDAEIADLILEVEQAEQAWQSTLSSEIKTALLASQRAKEIRRLERRIAEQSAQNLKLFDANRKLAVENQRLKDQHKPFMNVTRGPGGKWTSLKSVGAGA